MNICVIGTWHQASVVAACLAELGHHVRGVGEDRGAVEALGRGAPPVREPGLDELMGRHLASGRLLYTSDWRFALQNVDMAWICIDTPVGEDDSSDLGVIESAARCVADALSDNLIVCVGSQVPVGTCRQLAGMFGRRRPGRSVAVAYVPEFLRLGSAIETFLQADRFVVGADDAATIDVVAKVLEPAGRPIVRTTLETAEMAKHAGNAFLAASISFANEIADLCERVGADMVDVAKIMKLDRRIGPYAFVDAGLGFAGGTLGREIRAIQLLGSRWDVPTRVMDAVWETNRSRVRWVGEQLRRHFSTLRDKRVVLIGLTYKAGTSTLRRSPARDVIADLISSGASVAAYDPLARLDEARDWPSFDSCIDPQQAAKGADALVVLTPCDGFDVDRLPGVADAMRGRILLDPRNVIDPTRAANAGFRYVGVGRGNMTEGKP